MAVYAIGDLQGCLTPLKRLLDTLQFDPSKDELWFAGDLVNRGPESVETLRFVRSLGASARCVLGNHDLHLLAAASGFGKKSNIDTLRDVLDAPDRSELVDWLRQQPLAVQDARFPGLLMVHAGLLPQWTAQDALMLAAEVETVLRSDQWTDFMKVLYGNQPDRWHPSLAGFERLRLTVNALTRLRFCTADGVMDFEATGSADSATGDHMPWFTVPGRKSNANRIIFGHWSTLGLTVNEQILAIDTGCVWGGCLTAVRLEDDAVFQTQCPQARDPLGE